MSRLLLLLVFFLFWPALFFSQSPVGINYQGVARDQNGAVISNTLISLKFDILQNSSLVYSEQHLGISTGPSGVFTAVIGSKSALQFKNINWAAKNTFMQVHIDINGGTQFVAAGNPQPLQYVPYSLFAENVPANYAGNVLTIGSQNFTLSSPPVTTVNITGTGLASVTATSTNFTVDVPAPTLTVSGNNIILTSGSSVTSASIASTPNTNITAAGIVSLTTTGTNSFIIGAPSPTFTQVGPTSVTGSYPNYTITSAAAITPSINVTSSVGAAPSVSSAGSSFTINIPPSANSWSLGGNAGTSTATHFIGTIDAQDLVIKTNSAERLRIKSTGNVGVGTSAPTASFHVNGTTRLVDGTQGTDKVLTSDINGNASWQNSSRNTGFHVTNPVTASNQVIISYSSTPVAFLQEEFDDGNNFSSNSYTAPTQGVYSFQAVVNFIGGSTTTGMKYLWLMKNGTAYKTVYSLSEFSPTTCHVSATIKLNAGDVINLFVYQNSGANLSLEVTTSFFSGHRVY